MTEPQEDDERYAPECVECQRILSGSAYSCDRCANLLCDACHDEAEDEYGTAVCPACTGAEAL